MRLRYYGYVCLAMVMAGCATLVDADAPYRLDESEESVGSGGAGSSSGSGNNGGSISTSTSGSSGNVSSSSSVSSSGGVGSSSSTGSSSGGGTPCMQDNNCSPTGNACVTEKCISGYCTPVNAATGTNCMGGQCDGNGTCKMGSALGATCQIGAQCISGYCTDGVCCDSKCDETCKVCTSGMCGGAALGSQELMCTGTKACDGAGTCKSANGQICFANSDCASGNCTGMPKMCAP